MQCNEREPVPTKIIELGAVSQKTHGAPSGPLLEVGVIPFRVF
jgi:hypothetical protein